MKKNVILTIIYSLFLLLPLYAQSNSQDSINWLRIAGDWFLASDDTSSFLFQKRIRPVQWNYSLPSNYSSIISTIPFAKYTSIQYNLKLPHIINDVECVLFFAVEKSEKSVYHNLHAVRISSDEKSFNKSTFIKTTIIDPTRLNAKGNFKIEELSTSSFSTPINQRLSYEIKFTRNTIILYINGNKIHTQKTNEKVDEGMIGIGIKNAQMNLYDIKIFNGRNLVLHDDFSKDTIKVMKAVMKKVSKDEFDRLKQQQQNKR